MVSLDKLTREGIVSQQTAKLRALLAEIVPRNRFWTERLAGAGVQPSDLRTPEDLRRLPFVTKAEIVADQQAQAPYGTNLTYPANAYSRLHQTSGTTGTPMRWLDTPSSWAGILGCWEKLFGLMGLRPDDRLFFAFSFGPFLGFWAGFEGANRLGNLCVPAGGLSSEARLRLLLDNHATVVCCTPTYALRLAEVAASQNIDLRAGSVRALLVAGEPGGNIPATRRRIEETWGARVIDHWGMTELGPLAIEPEDRPGGLTVLETDCIAEIVHPDTGEPVGDGQEGELIVTNLGRPGSPLIRYRTGDRVRKAPESRTGRGGVLMHLTGGILGRTDEMLTVRGNNVYPAALEDVVRASPEVAEFRIELDMRRAMHHVKVDIEPLPHLSASETRAVVDGIAQRIKDRWHFHVEVVAVAPGSLPRFEMKARRFVRVEHQ